MQKSGCTDNQWLTFYLMFDRLVIANILIEHGSEGS